MTEYVATPSPTYDKRLIALGAAITVAFCTVFGVGLWESRIRDREQARLAAMNVIASMSSEIERNLELYGLSLDAVVDGLNLPDIDRVRPELRQRVLFDRAATAKDMGSIFVLDRNGTLTHDSRLLAPMPEDHSERDYFFVQKRSPSAGLHLSEPWRAIDGRYIAISRALVDNNGDFSGVVVGTMRLSYFETMFRELKMGEGDTIALIRENGTVVMRAPVDTDMIGRSLAGSPVFARLAENSSGSFEDVGRIDGIERLFVFRRVAAYPLILSYNLSTANIYAGWRRKGWYFGALILGICAFNLMLLILLTRALKHRSEAEARMSVMASTDSLTGLVNRRALDDAFGREWQRALCLRKPVALLMLDADSFKAFNDAFGHQAGDGALNAIANCIRRSGGSADEIYARYGGEEFAILLPGLNVSEATERADAVRGKILALRAEQRGRPDSTPTVSIGVASMVPKEGLEPRDLIKAADAALYTAKANGRNRVECANHLSIVASGTAAA